ncbi:LPS assembly protein LptD [Rheinheimera sp.]|uniref:LPS assembly protein LptD n=1 Tax=Rheinheimera sp. TaxID=1869214 RepID=UPI003D2CFCAA
MKYQALYLLMFGLPGLALAAEPVRQCYPTLTLPERLAQLDKNDNNLRIFSGKVRLNDNQSAVFSDGVELTHRDTLLSAPSATFSKAEQQMFADGGISYYSPQLKVSSSSFSARVNDNNATMTDADYRFISQAGRGYAKEMQASSEQVTLKEASFTTCPDGDNGWALEAEDIQLNADDGWGEAWNSVVKIKGVPVLYLPYMTFPVSNQRKSGLLIPKFGSSQKLGVDLQLPYYLNLADNYDATITPRYMSERGTQLKTEFRYLTAQDSGKLQLEFLPEDQDKPAGFGSRYLSHVEHRSDFADNWRAQVDFTDVSDDGYLSELGSDFNNQSDTQLNRQASLSYFGADVRSDIRLQGFEILGNYADTYSYAALPQWDLQSARPLQLPAGVEFSWHSQYSHFANDNAPIKQADRLHLEPTLRLPYVTPAYELQFETGLMSTFYQQKRRTDLTTLSPELALVAEDTERHLPKVQLNGKLNFERDARWFGQSSLQTLEPQIQYLYIPYRDQSQIWQYDTARLQDDYYGLFRQNRFSGLDRINDANQLTLGATTRIYDEFDTERFRFSLGQILFLATPDGKNLDNNQPIAATESIFAAESVLHFQQRWFLNNGVQYDSKTKRVIKSNVSLDYRADDKNLLQLNHRYSRYVSGNEIEQLGALGTMPLNNQWQLVGSYYRDLHNDRMIEANVGLQYESCCWAVRLIARRQIETNLDLPINNINSPFKLDSGIALQFVLKGFGDSAGFNVSDMLSTGVFGYRRPYLLNN